MNILKTNSLLYEIFSHDSFIHKMIRINLYDNIGLNKSYYYRHPFAKSKIHLQQSSAY